MKKSAKKIIPAFLIFFVGSLALAKSISTAAEIDLDKELKSFKSLNAFDGPLNKKLLKPLATVKVYQAERQFSECYKAGLNLLGASEIKEWLSTTILQCLQEVPESKKKSVDLKKAVEVINALKLEQGPWKAAFGEAWTLSLVALYDEATTTLAKEKILQIWAQHWDLLSKEQQSAWMDTKADFLIDQKKSAEAAFYLKQSQDLVPSKNLNDKILNLLGLKANVMTKLTSSNDLSQEPKMDEQIQKLLSTNQVLSSQALMIEYLKQFPQGKQSKKYKDKALDIYFSLTKEKQEEALKNLLSADPQRWLEWSQTLHRKGDFKAALAMTEKALAFFEASPSAATLLWIKGRSAQFIGQDEKALQAFDQLNLKHSASDEALEAQFREGLIYFRKSQFEKAITFFDQVKNSNRDRFQLNAWYWLVRCLQKQNDAKAEIEREALIARYPFSYYGLRLRAEKQEGLISFPEVTPETAATEKSKIPLLPHQQQIWKRFKILAENGWVLEAQQEISGLPQPVTSVGLWKWIQLLAKAQQPPSVILLTNRLIEQDASFRNPKFISLSYPQSYATWIEPEAKKYSMDPFLIRSLVRQESAFSLRAISTSNAMGLMQMIPPTADEIAHKLKMKVQIPDDMYRPEVNVPMGTFYVSEMLRQFSQNVPMALAAYNAGPVRLKSWLELRPEIAALRENHSSEPIDELWFDELPWTETSFYVKAILRNVLIYQSIDKGPVTLKPVFWSDLSTKSAPTPASMIVK